ncbi:MAG: hypothetical protein ACF787_02295 [Rhodopirellula sp. JB053]
MVWQTRIVWLVTLLAAGWVGMTMSHEAGHLIGGFMGGATLVDCDLAPWRLPYSFHSPDPYPLLTLWSGPVIGVAMPLAVALLLRRPWMWFIADFCLLANGSYLALSWISGDRFLDAPRLLAAGAHPLSIITFCLVTIGVGYTRFRSDCVALLSESVSEQPAAELSRTRSE